MYPQSVASNSALERQAFIRKQADEIEALKIENAKLRRNAEVYRDGVSVLTGSLHIGGVSSDPQGVIDYLTENLSEV